MVAGSGAPGFCCGTLDFMTPELVKKLQKLELVINSAIPILERHEVKIEAETHLRTPLIIAIMSQAIEHHQSMLMLLMHERTGSALTLARSIFDGMYRGLWIDKIATDAEVERFVRNDEIEIPIGEMAKAIDGLSGAGTHFNDLRKIAWGKLCSFSHNGMQQLGRRFTGTLTRPSYSEDQIASITELATVCILFLIQGFLEARGFTREVEDVTDLMLLLPAWDDSATEEQKIRAAARLAARAGT
jgi:Family of unknown function (DUF6988)